MPDNKQALQLASTFQKWAEAYSRLLKTQEVIYNRVVFDALRWAFELCATEARELTRPTISAEMGKADKKVLYEMMQAALRMTADDK